MIDYGKTVRRKDRQETDLEFRNALLRDSLSCSIAVEKEGYPFIQSTFFVYDQTAGEIIFHFSKYGYAGQVITNGKKAAVSVYRYGKLYTAERAVDFGGEYQSIVLYGTIRIVEDESERIRAMQAFFDKFFPEMPKGAYRPFTSGEAQPIHVAAIRVEDWFGKQHRVPEKALEAFDSPPPRMMFDVLGED